MDNARIREIVETLIGLKRFEWNAIQIAVEKNFDSASNRLQLKDAESLQRLVELEQ